MGLVQAQGLGRQSWKGCAWRVRGLRTFGKADPSGSVDRLVDRSFLSRKVDKIGKFASSLGAVSRPGVNLRRHLKGTYKIVLINVFWALSCEPKISGGDLEFVE